MAEALDTKRLNLYLNPKQPLDEEELDEFRPLIKKRKEGIPLQYITGKVNFMGLTLQVDKRALIPRPETEELVEKIIAKHRGEQTKKMLDLGTGSGAIAIALARFMNNPRIMAIDIDSSALDLARDNATTNQVQDNITFRRSDWFEEIDGKFDLIVSNPPYVSADKMEDLEPKIKNHEPTKALDGGKNGLEEIESVLTQAPAYLNNNGQLWLEISSEQSQKAKELGKQVGLYDELTLFKDASGQDRMLLCIKRGLENG